MMGQKKKSVRKKAMLLGATMLTTVVLASSSALAQEVEQEADLQQVGSQSADVTIVQGGGGPAGGNQSISSIQIDVDQDFNQDQENVQVA